MKFLERVKPETLWAVNMAILLALAVSLLMPLFGQPLPHLPAVAVLLLIRTLLQMWHDKLKGGAPRPLTAILPMLLLGLLLFQLGQS